MDAHERIVFSLDGFTDVWEAVEALNALGPLAKGGIVKIKGLLDRHGTDALVPFLHHGYRPFVDFKVHDTPDAAAERAVIWRGAGAEFFTVHASGRDEMVRKCVEAGGMTMKIIAVTVLTSFDRTDAMHVFGASVSKMVGNLAWGASCAGAHGIVASPRDMSAIDELKKYNRFSLPVFTPAVRPLWAAKNDQSRIATPAEAIKAGADYLIIGRPIFKPPTEIGGPKEAFARIVEEIKSAHAQPQGPS
ncbi:MAG: orotidine 5'-phosphate decarboxylase [Parcubacteria group bacterium]|nr:orotidine 5'-phosphate decarboxylase [Parcubacteria group bacterium]